jgi:hypothetical protein
LPDVVFVRIKIMAKEKRFPRNPNIDAFAGCWLAVIIVVINCMTNSRQKKLKTINASDLNSPVISPGVLRMLAQFKNGFIQ